MSTFDVPPSSACIACQLYEAHVPEILIAGAIFGKAWGVDKIMEKLCPTHWNIAKEAIGKFEKAIDAEDHRRGARS